MSSYNKELPVKNEVLIRKAQFNDLKEMSRLLEQLFAIESDFEYDYARHYQALKFMYAKEGVDLLVAKQCNRVIGMVTMQTLISTAQGGISGVIEDLIIDQAFRGSGVGTQLLSTLCDIAQKRGYVRLQLAADQHNEEALAFYDTQNFSRTNLFLLHRIEA